MFKKIGILLAIVILVTAAGCSSGNTTGTPTQPAGLKQIRQTEVAGQWAVNQMEINLDSNISILLKLAPGDKVDGYFYLEKGDGVNFQVSGKSLIYESKPGTATSSILSDRFSFTASDAQGIAYSLKFTPVEKVSGTTTAAKGATPVVFLEIIYPKSGDIFEPIGTK